MSKRKLKKKYSSDEQANESLGTQTPLTENQVYDVLKFASEYYNTYHDNSKLSFTAFNGVYTPDLTNERLSEIGLSSKKIDSETNLQEIFKNPINNQDRLVGYSEYIKFTDMIAKRSLGYLGNLAAFDYTFVCNNINDPSEYNSQEYQDDLKIVKDFLARFDVKGQFSYVNRRTFELDTFYSVFRMDGERYEFQELPYNYCKITGRNLDWGLQFDFDMDWFSKQGLSLDQYPPIFKKMWNKTLQSNGIKRYDPSNDLEHRNGTFVTWVQTSSLPNKGNFACFKMNSDIFATIPYLTPMFQDAINKPLIRALQNDQYIIASQKILIGLIPLLKDQKSGQVKDALAVSPETMGRFLGLLKKGLSNAIKITGAPFEDVKQVEFDSPQSSIYNQTSEVEAANSGVTSRLIYSSDKQSATEVMYSAEIDSMIGRAVYPQYEKWLSSMVNFFTKKYKFSFKFEGTNYSTDRKDRLDNALKLADKGIVMPAKIAAAMGMNIFEMKELIQQCKYDNFQDILYLLPNSNTRDYGSATITGRPKTDTPSDSLERSDDYVGGGGN